MANQDDEVVSALLGTAVLALGGYTIYRVLKALTKEEIPAGAASTGERTARRSEYTSSPVGATFVAINVN